MITLFKNRQTIVNHKTDAAKEIISKWKSSKKIGLSHVQIDLLAKSLGFEVRHYTEFLGKMPHKKIFNIKTENDIKIYKIVDLFAIGLKDILVETAKHGIYHTEKELNNFRSYLDSLKGYDVKIMTTEYPAIFIMAPSELFVDKKLTLPLDPIMVEMTNENEYTVTSFWNVPENIAVDLVHPESN